MQDEFRIRRILAKLDEIKLEVKAMLAEPKPEPKPESKLEQKPAAECRPPEIAAAKPRPVIAQPFVKEAQPTLTAIDRFWAKIEDWLAVRGDFAPKGVTHEFAFATHWLLRVGALLLVGAIVYFLMLAIDKGWIGPAQRVYGMMAWGVAGTAFGTWLKLKSERYAILGEVVAALGLVAAYLSFGLGHRFFSPPVIASGYVASALLATGIVRRVKVVRLWGLWLLAVSVVKLLLFDTASLATPGRVGVFAAVGVLLIAGAFLYLKFKSFFEEESK